SLALMRCHYAPLLLILVQVSTSFKFLAFSPQFAVSHVNFLAKVADTLVDAGHEVVILAPCVDPAIRGARSKKARVIEVPENEFSRRWDAAKTRAMDLYWNTSMLALASEGSELFEMITLTVNETIHHPGLMDQLRAEKFDAAFAEDPSGFGIFHLLGIEKTALTISFTNFEFFYAVTQMSSAPSYVPSILAPWSDRMSFLERVGNLFSSTAFALLMSKRIDWLQPIFEEDLWKTTASNSLVFLNSEPLLDFPRPTAHRIVEIGGVVMATEGESLDEYWSYILSLRNRTVIVSFGTYIKTSTMPEAYKDTMRRAMAKFEDVTFIWKYENPEHNVSQGISNIVETKWLPQVAILNDPRFTAFITHGGQGSTLEAAYAGIPMLMVPTQGDQYRNAAMIKRAGLGDIVRLDDLLGGDRLEAAIRDLLENPEYTANAKKMSAMLKERPFSAKENLVRNMEFLAKYGPLRVLDHEGRNLNFIQYYLLDVFLFLSFVTVHVLGLISLCCVAGFRCCCRQIRGKYATLKQD
ncbi:hypothetical protein PRIPAC_78466, partial [Pristionchus pacificus]